ncbi:hypothetical protein ABKN59_000488 [Abortiporus biennis]
MKRLAAVFSSRRSSKSDAGTESVHSTQTTQAPDKSNKSRSTFFRSLSRSHTSSTPVADKGSKRPPVPNVSTTQTPSSSSSSSGGPHTPDDDGASFIRNASTNKPWPWLVESGPPSGYSEGQVLDPQRRSKPLPPVSLMSRAFHEEIEGDTSADETSESELPSTEKPTPMAYLRALTVHGIAPPFSPPPLLHVPHRPLYPRSVNPSRNLHRDNSLRCNMLRKHLLKSIDQRGPSRLDQSLLAAFHSRQHLPKARPSLLMDDDAIKKMHRIVEHSEGLARWVSRPYFEDRMLLYLQDTTTGLVNAMRIPGSRFGVAALEFSEGLEELAGPVDLTEDAYPVVTASPTSMTQFPSSFTSPPTNLPASSSLPSNMPSQQVPKLASPPAPGPQGRNQPYKAAAPSPLRSELPASPLKPTLKSSMSTPSASTADKPAIVQSASAPTIVLSPGTPEPSLHSLQQPAARTGVRFAEDDRDDQVPLGYVLRTKRKREEKARFLEAEKQRRIHEEQRRKYEEERQKQEAERQKWEMERSIWEKERRAMEEEKKKRQYAEEVIAARSRREIQRLGALPRPGIDGAFSWDGDREHEREVRGREARPSYSRMKYDSSSPRRQGSDQSLRGLSPAVRHDSSGSSRPPSVGGTGSASGSIRGSSRPQSMYSTPHSSTPDVHSRERRESKGSYRGSIMSESSQRPYIDQGAYMQSYPWTMNPAMVPPVPQLPTMQVVPVMPYMMDMPLLPPAPPFMMHQFGRPQQQRSYSSSPAPSSHKLPASQSSDRVNEHGKRHERRSSGDISQLHRERNRSGSFASQPAQHDRRSINSAATTSKGVRPSARPTSSNSPSRGSPRPPSMPTSSSRTSSPAHPHSSYQHPVPVPVLTSSWSQPGFQNLSRPSGSRRQTMIS